MAFHSLRERKTPKISRFKLQEEFAGQGWGTCVKQFESVTGESEYHIVSSPTKYSQSSFKKNVPENCSKKKSMLIEISNIESVFKENKLNSFKNIARKSHDFNKKIHKKEKSNQKYELKKPVSESFNLRELEAVFQTGKKANGFKYDICLSNLKKYNKLKKSVSSFSVKKYTNKNADPDVKNPLSDSCAHLSAYKKEKSDILSISNNEHCKNVNSELCNFPVVPHIKNLQHEKSLNVSSHSVSNYGISSSTLNSCVKELCINKSNRHENLSKGFVGKFSAEEYPNENSSNIMGEHNSTVYTKVLDTTFLSFRNDCVNNTHGKSHYKKLYLLGPESAFQTNNQNCDKSLRSSSHVILNAGNGSTILNDFCFNDLKSHKILSEDFVRKFLDEKCANETCDTKKVCSPSINNIEEEHSPSKSIDIIQSPFEYNSVNKLLKNDHRRLCSELSNLEDPKIFQIESQHCNKPLNICNHTTFTSSNSLTLIHSNKELHFNNSNLYKKLSESFVQNFTKEHINKNLDNDINIEYEHSPTKSNEILCSNPPLLQNGGVNKETKFNHLKRCSSNAFNLHDLEESFQIGKKCRESSNDVNLITADSPTKSNSEKKIYLNSLRNFRKVSEAFTSISVSGECMKKNSDSSVSIKYESSPECVKSIEDFSSFRSVKYFSEDNNSSNSLSKYKHSDSEEKHIVFDNKAFIKILQSNVQDKLSTADKGSDWVHSLKWDDDSQSKDVHFEDDKFGKKIVKNILPGGFAEQMLKVQRKERSDRVIWDHKINELKKKVETKSLTFILTSYRNFGCIIYSKCILESDNRNIMDIMDIGNSEATYSNNDFSVNDGAQDMPSHDTMQDAKVFILLFKKKLFSKLHLKTGDKFVLYPPWQVLNVHSLAFPVILCAYFVDPIFKSLEAAKNEIPTIASVPVVYNTPYIKSCKCKEPAFSNTSLFNSSDFFGKSVCISARIQRVWKRGITCKKVQDILKINNYLSFSVILHTKDNVFLELKINSEQLPESYFEFLSEAEGKCYKFCDIVMSHRYDLQKCPKLRSIMQFIKSHVENYKALASSHMFCYQFMPNSFAKIPCSFSDENFPAYCDYEVKPLSFLQKNTSTGARFSCIGKILFQNKEEFYISDESLLISKLQKYFKLKFASFKASKQFVVHAIVFVREAMVDRDCLFVDEFSNCEIISSDRANKLPLCESRLKKIDLITFEHILSPLVLSSKEKELVLIKGTIFEVDENTAMSWLECSYCLKENLLEDSSSVIYCEDCSCVVPRPVLKVKMEVIVFSPFLSSAKLKIQLLSSTIKRILEISEDNYQPQCNISDVLEKSTGDLCCYIKNVETLNELKVFHLTEVNSS